MGNTHAFEGYGYGRSLILFLCLLTYPEFSVSLIDHRQGNRIVIVPLDCNLQDIIDAHHFLLNRVFGHQPISHTDSASMLGQSRTFRYSR
jgi:hypothetical protein